MRPQESKSAFQGLVEAGIALSAELTLDALLQRLVEAAAELTGARYAALGVVDASGKELERFITDGIDPETHAAIGELPRGEGILGVLIRDARPLRLHSIAEDDRSVGFPPNHPPMKTFLGVPILLRGVAYGNLYLTEKEGDADFTEEDEEVVTLLASQAAVAIENARLYESSREWARQLESLDEITNAMLSEIEPGRLLQLVVDRMSGLLEARFVAALLVAPADGWLEIAAAHGEQAGELLGERVAVERSKAGRVFLEGMPVRVDSVLDDPDADPDLMRRIGARAGLWAPLVVRGQTIGVLMALDRLHADPRFSDADLRLAQRFAARAAVALDLSRRVARTTVQRIVGGQEQERRRLSRELHDETGQALTSILLGLKAIEDSEGTERFSEALGELREIVVATLQDVRRLAVELRPKALDDFGLVPALERLTSSFAEQTGIEAHLESRLPETRLPSEIETVLYRVVQEALTNVVKHAQAEHVSVLLHSRPGRVAVVIEDDGRGFADQEESDGIGLLGMEERLALVGGSFDARIVDGRRHYDRRRGSGGMSVRILIVDDHAVVRTGLRLLLDAEDGLETVAEAGNARDAVFEARKHKPDVILMDVVLPERSGIEATPDVLEEAPDAKVLVLSMQDDPSYVRQAFSAGASGYVLKEAADTELVTAVRQVAAGERYVHPALGARMAAAEAEAAARADADPLSDREREVLRLLALGHTNQEIAKMLFISVRTAETHRAHIMQKLRLTTRAELVRYALAQGLLEE